MHGPLKRVALYRHRLVMCASLSAVLLWHYSQLLFFFTLHRNITWLKVSGHLFVFTATFFYGATTLVESWPSQQYPSISGNLGLVPSIL